MPTDPSPWAFSTGAGTDPDPFDPRRYGKRVAELDSLLASSEDRFWDPANDAYLDLATPFDTKRTWIMPAAWFPELRSAVTDRLDEAQQIQLGNEVMRWMLSGILHGEQAALSVCAQLCGMARNPSVQAFLANQAREEARHVDAFTRYIGARWGSPYPVGDAFGGLIRHMTATDDAERKLLGIALVVEGFAMGVFASFRTYTGDPALAQMMQLLLRDEAPHHSAGSLWLDRAVPDWSDARHEEMTAWALKGFRAMRLNAISIRQRRAVYQPFGLDWRWVRDAVREARSAGWRTPPVEEETNPLTVLAHGLNRSGFLSATQRKSLDIWLGSANLD